MAHPTISRRRGITYTPHRGPLAGQTFTTERGYHDALALVRGYASARVRESAPRSITTPADLERLRAGSAAARQRALGAVARMRRDGLSLHAATDAAGTTSAAVRRYGSAALRTSPRGRIIVTRRDHLWRELALPTPAGIVYVHTFNSQTASILGRYWAAIGEYLEGDDAALRVFAGKVITIGGRRITLPGADVITRLALAGDLDIDTIYAIDGRR